DVARQPARGARNHHGDLEPSHREPRRPQAQAGRHRPIALAPRCRRGGPRVIDVRAIVRESVRLHPRVAYQSLGGETTRPAMAGALPELVPFGEVGGYRGLIAVLDWDHRIPSKQMILRLYAYTSEDALQRGEAAFDQRLEEIGQRDRFPEFDVPDFA